MELIKVENGVALLNPETSQKIAEFERQVKAIKEQEDQLKETILNEMKAQNIIKLDTPELSISYIAESFREQFDSKRFKEQNQDLYDEYVNMTPVKASIRIKVK